jgi:hypothetical protein
VAEDRDRLEESTRRAKHAEVLLNDPLLKEAFASLERDYIEAWKATSVVQTDARERLWQALQIVGKVRDHLALLVADGKVAAKEIERIERLGERRKILGVV